MMNGNKLKDTHGVAVSFWQAELLRTTKNSRLEHLFPLTIYILPYACIIHKTNNLHLLEFHPRNENLNNENDHSYMFELLKNNE